MSEKLSIELTKNQARSILQPPAPNVDAKDDKLAKARFAYDCFISDAMYDAMIALKYYTGQIDQEDQLYHDKPEEFFRKQAQYFLDAYAAVEKREGDEFWDAWIPNDHFENYVKPALGEIHAGDCTAIPATCNRCYAEEKYRLPPTANWYDKSLGYKLWNFIMSKEDA